MFKADEYDDFVKVLNATVSIASLNSYNYNLLRNVRRSSLSECSVPDHQP